MGGERWVKFGERGDFEAPGPHAVTAGGKDLVVLRAKGGLRAFEGRCPHQGALLGEGELEGDRLICRNHRWRFDVETGKREGGPECLQACPIREVEGAVEVDIAALDRKATGPAAPTRRAADLPGPQRLPLIGSSHLIRPAAIHQTLAAWAREFGSPFTYNFGPKPVVVFSEIDDILGVLRERPERFRRLSTLEPIFEELTVGGVFSAEGKAWRPQRKLSMEALSHRHLRTVYPKISGVADRLRRRWSRAAKRGEVLDIAEELKRFTVDVTTQIVFGYDLNTLEQGDDVIQRKLELLFPLLNRRLFSLIPYWRYFKLPSDRRAEQTLVELRAWIDGLLQTARQRMLADPGLAERPENFLQAMLAARDDAGRPFDDDQIFGNAMQMLLAGEDTTAYTLAWAVHHMIDVPAEVKALRAELDAVLGPELVPPNIEAAGRLERAAAVANEAMRLRPVAPVLFFEANEPTIVAGVEIPKAGAVSVLTGVPAVSPKHFGDPRAFRPSRWLDPSSVGGVHDAGASQPFGSGPRICPGRSLALLEMRVVLATLYASFDVERVGAAAEVREEFAFTMTPKGIRVRLRERSRSASASASV
jgi:cytochrome P450/nitrite reductase/ring-hydroxylating ferredoxin subunit